MDDLPEVLLFVKAGADGKRYGACPFCQRIFMILRIKADADKLAFKVATVNLAKPPEEFKKQMLHHVPAIIHGDDAMDNLDDIIQYLDEKFPTDSLQYDNPNAEKACKDVFQKFCFFIKEVSKDGANLVSELGKLDAYLTNSGTKFLCSNQITHLDCEVLPKLHHIRIAANGLKKFEIPPSMQAFWNYMKSAYAEPIFAETCPSDQEIILHWADKPETPKIPMDKYAQMTKEPPKFTFTVP